MIQSGEHGMETVEQQGGVVAAFDDEFQVILQRPAQQTADQSAQHAAMADDNQVPGLFGQDAFHNGIETVAELLQRFPGGESEIVGKGGPLIDALRVVAENLGEIQPFP